jgi:hypothetical protein
VSEVLFNIGEAASETHKVLTAVVMCRMCVTQTFDGHSRFKSGHIFVEIQVAHRLV